MSEGQRIPERPIAEKPFQPVGNPRAGVIEILDAHTAYNKSNAESIKEHTRSFLVKLISMVSVFALIFVTIYSFYSGSYTSLSVVWGVIAPTMGVIVGYYFGSHRKETG